MLKDLESFINKLADLTLTVSLIYFNQELRR